MTNWSRAWRDAGKALAALNAAGFASLTLAEAEPGDAFRRWYSPAHCGGHVVTATAALRAITLGKRSARGGC
jgi:hypothetical protein